MLGMWLVPRTGLLEVADRVAGQLRGDKEYPFSGVTKSGASLEESAEKRCSECAETVDVAIKLAEEFHWNQWSRSPLNWKPYTRVISSRLTWLFLPPSCESLFSPSNFVSLRLFNTELFPSLITSTAQHTVRIYDDDDDCFYIALFFALERAGLA